MMKRVVDHFGGPAEVLSLVFIYMTAYQLLHHTAKVKPGKALDMPAGQAACVASGRTGAPPRTRYLPIAEHGLIGDLHTVAPAGTDGTIDWYCCLRVDSPSVFAAIHDADRGACSGSRRTVMAGSPSSSTFRPDCAGHRSEQRHG